MEKVETSETRRERSWISLVNVGYPETVQLGVVYFKEHDVIEILLTIKCKCSCMLCYDNEGIPFPSPHIPSYPPESHVINKCACLKMSRYVKELGPIRFFDMHSIDRKCLDSCTEGCSYWTLQIRYRESRYTRILLTV